MSQTPTTKEKIKEISTNNRKTLKIIINKLKQIMDGKRDLMYSDIINIIIREGFVGENYNQIILWCNYKIRLGKTFVEFE